MREILAEELQPLFDQSLPNGIQLGGECTYKGNLYEVWEISDEVFDIMCDMPEEDFESACPGGMWRSSKGSNLEFLPHGEFTINSIPMIGWERGNDEIFGIGHNYSGLLEYLCSYIGASTPKNVCACAVDLAKINSMKLSELFEKYEG